MLRNVAHMHKTDKKYMYIYMEKKSYQRTPVVQQAAYSLLLSLQSFLYCWTFFFIINYSRIIVLATNKHMQVWEFLLLLVHLEI